jgi:arabinofuranosyltransferase
MFHLDDIGRNRFGRAALISVVCAYAFTVLRTAWLDDDCFITLRVVDNFVHGYGLRWNVDERVQAFTHPLWLFLISSVYALTREAFFTTVLLSAGVSIAAFVIYTRRVAASPQGAILGGVVLILSSSYIDYSTSGLETPLTHLLLVLLLWAHKGFHGGRRQLFCVALLGALLALNRGDLLLIAAPFVASAYFRSPRRGRLRWAIAGLAPLLAWEIFSLVYYGFLLPNTAYAKLYTGIPQGALVAQGLLYLLNQLLNDPVSLAAIALLFVSFATTRERGLAAPCLGVALYLGYVISIGGCFMLGRFFTAPLLVSVVALTSFPLRIPVKGAAAVAATALAIGLSIPRAPALLTGLGRGARHGALTIGGVGDERHFYIPGNGLVPNLFTRGPHPRHSFGILGWRVRDRKAAFVVSAAGMPGYFAGPLPHLVDMFALSDPLLARLPARGAVRVGHYERMIPEGYLETLTTGEDHFRDRALAAYHAHLVTITRGPLFTAARWRAIAEMLLGRDDHLIDRDLYSRGFVEEATLRDLAKLGDTVLPFDRTLISPDSGLSVTLGGTMRVRWFDALLDRGSRYEFSFYDGAAMVGRQKISTRAGGGVPYRVPVPVPEDAVRAGYDRIVIAIDPKRGGAIGHLRPAPEYADDVPIERLRAPIGNGSPWLAQGAVEIFSGHPLHVRLDAPSHAPKLYVSLDSNDDYRLEFLEGGRALASLNVAPPRIPRGGLSGAIVKVPVAAAEPGYDEIRVKAVRDDGFSSIGHLILAD